jgi:1-deoxy-D-xylulose-5-phosphate synthase
MPDIARSDGGKETMTEKGNILDRVVTPSDLKDLERDQLVELCREIREYIIEVVSQQGGHLGASLGVVELTVALCRILDLPEDKVVFDTGHQAYVHKVLTGRKEKLWGIRQYGGISGFLKRTESEYDAFGAGHASTAISAALGLATARDMAGKDNKVVAILGDGAMTGGLAYEALNNAGQSGCNLLVILNDNGMSIGPNVGALSQYLTNITTNPTLMKIRDDVVSLVKKLPAGDMVGGLAKRMESGVKSAFVPSALFEALGFTYFGPVDGHDLEHLLDILTRLLDRGGPVLLHVHTKKGKGLTHAEKDDEGFHGVVPFDPRTGKIRKQPAGGTPGYTEVFGQAMLEAADQFPQMAAITAAMSTGTGLNPFKEKYPDRFFDVGIAEAHAVCFAAGLACEGVRPVVTIYSTFLQRAYDQLIHDVALQKLPVIFALDRGGLVGSDGPTHHGVLDLSYLTSVPDMVVAAPKDGNELRDMLWTAMDHTDGPFAFRYPRASVPEGWDPTRLPQVLPIGSWEILREGDDVAILAVGARGVQAMAAAETLAAAGTEATVVNARFVKPLDEAMLRDLYASRGLLVTVEENSIVGGFGAVVSSFLENEKSSGNPILRLALPDGFVTHGPRERLLDDVGLSAGKIAARILAQPGR